MMEFRFYDFYKIKFLFLCYQLLEFIFQFFMILFVVILCLKKSGFYYAKYLLLKSLISLHTPVLLGANSKYWNVLARCSGYL